MPDDSLIRFGTAEPATPSREVRLGALAFRLEGGNLRSLCWKGTEAVRGLSAPIRDESRGTLSETDATEEVHETADRFLLRRRFRAAEGALEGELAIDADAEGRVEARVTLRALRDIHVNRAGFCLLHPLQGVAGEPLLVTHADGREEEAAFPAAISPSQPVVDIHRLRHRVGSVDVEIAFEGETFEMEDQRNWADASFKTYCRPLSLPRPYGIGAGETVTQGVIVTLRDAAGRSVAAAAAPPSGVPMPEVLLAAEPGWLAPGMPFPAAGLLLRLRAGEEAGEATLEEVTATLSGGGLLDLEVVLPEGVEPGEALDAMGRRLALRGLHPRHVIALPETFLRSYQPTDARPGEPGPEACAVAARRAFPEARIGWGMLTLFTELNRHPGAGDVGDYVTHGSSAIVHAADDASVLETLEALPQVFADARTIAGARALRLGLVSIGMRSNPYGAGLAGNPGLGRRTMTDRDPRQRGLLGAAYAIGAAAAAAAAGAEALALAAPAGPFGILEADGAARPILHAMAALHGALGQEVRVDPVEGLRGLAWDRGAILANAALAPVTVPAPFPEGAILSPATAGVARDPAWLRSATEPLMEQVTLGPCECLFAGAAAGQGT